MGPTAAGKTDLALRLAQEGHYELVSVDSAMVYVGLDIGTAKPSKEVRAQIPHHLIDIVSPAEPYSAAKFVQDAWQAIAIIQQNGKIPVLVGGTMLYFKALQQGLSPLPPANHEIRTMLAEQASIYGWQAMHTRLASVDPEAARLINPNDQQRIQRALEVYELTAQPLSVLWQKAQYNPACQYVNIALIPKDRASLHVRIKARFEAMLTQGFLDEVAGLFHNSELQPHLPALRAVGYRQAWQYLAGEITYPEMVDKGIAATRQLAKRQLTWLRNWPALTYCDPSEHDCYARLQNIVRDVAWI
jgi:tRNA dimethylallyltransferase